MKQALLILLTLSWGLASAQDEVLFKVITYSDGVKIDGVPVTAGMDVSGRKKAVVIPPKGSMGIITKEGEVWQVRKSTRAGKVKVQFRAIWETDVYGVSESQSNIILTDSIFLSWANHSDAKDTTIITFRNMYGDLVAKVPSVGNYTALGLSNMWGNETDLLFEVQAKPGGVRLLNNHSVIKKNSPYIDGVKHDLSKLPMSDDRLFLESALFLLDNAVYDSTWRLYKILKSKKTTSDPILAAYYKLMYDRYQLGTVKLD